MNTQSGGNWNIIPPNNNNVTAASADPYNDKFYQWQMNQYGNQVEQQEWMLSVYNNELTAYSNMLDTYKRQMQLQMELGNNFIYNDYLKSYSSVLNQAEYSFKQYNSVVDKYFTNVDQYNEFLNASKLNPQINTDATNMTLQNQTGSYVIDYESGKTYVGKGPYSRALHSARQKASLYNDKILNINWDPASSNRQAFIDEYLKMKELGGPGFNEGLNYNKIWSPGRKYYYYDLYGK